MEGIGTAVMNQTELENESAEGDGQVTGGNWVVM